MDPGWGFVAAHVQAFYQDSRRREEVVRNEEEVLDRIRRLVKIPGASQIKVGIGDDCAIFRPRGSSEDLLFTTDMLLEDVHFRRFTCTPEAIGHKALARGLSDIA